MSLRQQTISGVRWNFFGRIASQSFQFVALIILARILTPRDFGLVGMTIVFTGFVTLFRDAGFASALIQRHEIDERHLSSIFWLNIGLGLLLAGLVAVSAPLIAAFFEEPRLVAITQVIAVDFVIGSFGIVQAAQLKRALRFRTLTLIEIAGRSAAGICAIILAVMGFGVWSLVVQSILLSAFTVVGFWRVSDWRPRLIWDRASVSELLSYSSNLLAYNVINYWTRNADNLLIGKFVGSAGLGIYSRAYGFMTLPLRQFSNVVGQVMFPVLSRVQGDIPRIKAAYLKANRLVALVTVPIVLGFMTTAESFVLTLLGPKWVDVIPVLQILCLMGVKQPVAASMGWLLTSMGRTDTMRKWAILSGTLNLIAVVIGVQWGIIGVAIGYVVFGYVIHYHSVVIPSSLVDVSFKEYHTNLAGVFGCGVAMALSIVGIDTLIPDPWPNWLHFGLQVVLGVVVYWSLVHKFEVRAYREFLDLLPSLTRSSVQFTRAKESGA